MGKVKKYGSSPYKVILVHGGPGAPGEMAPVARELDKNIGVLEPYQSKDSVGGQIDELAKVIKENNQDIILVGWSWGAWLVTLTAERSPEHIRKLILISSGPFEQKYAEDIMKIRISRLTPEEKQNFNNIVERLQKDGPDKDRCLHNFGRLISKVDSYNEVKHKDEVVATQANINEKVWAEAEKLRKTRELLRITGQIKCPVVAIHGEFDPHPWQGVKEPLKSVLKKFKFILLDKCGHHPWYEKYAKENFYKILRQEILG